MSGDQQRPMDLAPTDVAVLVDLVRDNLRLLTELVSRYEVGHLARPLPERVVRKPADVVAYLGPEMADLAQEQLRAVHLNAKNHLLGTSLVYQGGPNTIVVRLGDCFREAVRLGAMAVILVHNHPSGDASPSPEDIQLTAEASQAADLLGIELLDHLVLGRYPDFVSLRQHGLYTPSKYQPAGGRRRAATAACGIPSWEITDA